MRYVTRPRRWSMAIAWSRISSKVIANPPSPCKVYKRRCGHCGGHQDTFVPHLIDKRKQEVLGAHDVCTSLNRKGSMWKGRVHTSLRCQTGARSKGVTYSISGIGPGVTAPRSLACAMRGY